MADRILMKLEGTLGSPAVERWSVGVNFGSSDPTGFNDSAALSALAQEMADWLEVTTNGAAAFLEMASNVVLDRVSVYGYIGSGPAAASGQAALSPARAGTQTLNSPFQVARCVSLLTGFPGGRRRGRFYVPANAADVVGAGTAPLPPNYLAGWAAIFDHAQVAWTGTGEIYLGVFSGVDDVVTPVTQLRAGNVLDTQRRRRDSLPEVYSTLTY